MRLVKYTSVDEIIDDLIPVFLNHNGLIPMDWTPARKSVMFSLSEDFADRLIVLTAHLSEEDVELVYVSPSHYIKAAHKFQNACKGLSYNNNLVVSTYMDLCNAAVIGWNAEVKAIKRKLPYISFSDCTAKLQEKIAYLNSLARAFSESIYCDDHTIGGDICGPISTAAGSLIVREYRRLRPIELFSILEEFKLKSVVIYCVYCNNYIKVDLIGNLIQCDNMVNTLQKYYIEVVDTNDHTFIVTEEKQVEMLIAYLETWLKKIIVYYKGLHEQEKYRLLFQCEFYAFKPLFEYYNMSWMPQTFEIKDTVQECSSGIRLRNRLSKLTDEKEIAQCVKKILDPRA